MARDGLLRIGELSRRTGVKPDLLRAWERRYGLLAPQRTSGGFRLYPLTDVGRIEAMQSHLARGLSAAEAARLAKEQDEPGQAGSSIAALLDDFRAAMDAYDEPLAQLLLDRMLAAFTLETVLRDALLPYLHELGDRWERGEASVAQEHFASSVIRGRLLGLARGWGSGSGPLAVLACPPGEEHDLGLLVLGIVLRARGWRVAYLGPDTPMETLADAARRMGADWVVVSAVSEARLQAAEEEIARLVLNVRVALGGRGSNIGAGGAHGCRTALRRPGRRGGAARGQPPIASKGMAEPRSARLDEVASAEEIARLPYSLRVLLENVVRAGIAGEGDPQEARAILEWQPGDEPHREISFRPARVLLQDFTGVPAIVDLAAMRDAMRDLGGEPARINPLLPSELVIDHSVQVDVFGSKIAIFKNTELEFERNRERYAFLRWGQEAFDDLRVVPPNTGIVHQVNLEYLARVVEERNGWAFPDTLVGTDSHTTMVNSLGVLGWGVGGIEAEAAMLGEPLSMLVPQVVGFRLSGRLPEGSTATDLVLTVTETLRELGVVGKFVEFFGPGLSGLTLADRATIANMSPEYGATCGFFPVDDETLAYLRMTGRSEDHVARVESYCRAQLLFHDEERRALLQRGRGPRSRLGRAEPRRAAPSAGPRSAPRGPRLLPRSSSDLRRRVRKPRQRGRGDLPGQRPDHRAGAGRRSARMLRSPSRLSSRSPRSSRPRWRSSWTVRSSSWGTEASSSRRSRAARTPRTRPSWSRRACSRRTPSSAASSAGPG